MRLTISDIFFLSIHIKNATVYCYSNSFQLDDYHDLPQDELDDDDEDDKPNNIQTLRNTRLNTRPAKNFKMEVMDF